MSKIEPGDKFKVQYGNDRTVEVIALNMRQRRNMIKLMLSAQDENNPVQSLEAIEEALQICVVDCSEEFIDSIDEEMAMQIITATMEKQQLSDEELGKSESPH
jgi:hypothetical protein